MNPPLRCLRDFFVHCGTTTILARLRQPSVAFTGIHRIGGGDWRLKKGEIPHKSDYFYGVIHSIFMKLVQYLQLVFGAITVYHQPVW